MPGKTMVVSETKYPDRGIVEFRFLHDGKTYRVLPKEGAGDRIESFLRYVKYVCSKGAVSPFAFKDWKKYFDIDRVDDDAKKEPKNVPAPTKKVNKPEAEQMTLKLARKVELIASELSEKGLMRLSDMLKPISTGLKQKWLGQKSVGFFEDLADAEIQPEDAVAVLDAYEGGVAEGSQLAQITGFDTPMCGVVICLAKKHGLCATTSKF